MPTIIQITMNTNTGFYVKCHGCQEHIMIDGLDRQERDLILSTPPSEYVCYVCRRSEELKTEDSLVEVNIFA